jgi:hypothetical protein
MIIIFRVVDNLKSVMSVCTGEDIARIYVKHYFNFLNAFSIDRLFENGTLEIGEQNGKMEYIEIEYFAVIDRDFLRIITGK